jgi:hypothetical protein
MMDHDAAATVMRELAPRPSDGILHGEAEIIAWQLRVAGCSGTGHGGLYRP